MTGYAAASDDSGISVSVKSVNHRYLDISVKLPRALESFEDEARRLLSRKIARGRVDLRVNMAETPPTAFTLNKPLIRAYIEAVRETALMCGSTWDVTAYELLKMPGAVGFCEKTGGEDPLPLKDALFGALSRAADSLSEARETEGAALSADMSLNLDNMSGFVSRIEEIMPEAEKKRLARLTEKISELLSGRGLDEARILTEAALLADKSAVDEEVSRLKSHINQMREILRETGPVGRKLDFLAQEMNREANTIAAKSSDIELTRLALLLKNEIEKIREQAQNVE
jgi:uncharacterized protein (TIGR00255 family)